MGRAASIEPPAARAAGRMAIAAALAGFILLASAPVDPAGAVMTNESEQAASGDEDYAEGVQAFEREDWPEVIRRLSKVIERRPWHDNAHSLMGFAHRKLGDYDRSLRHYDEALRLNPHNRGALEYLGEAYLELGQQARAADMLGRLEEACRRVAPDAEGGDGESWQAGCEEWQDLKAAVDAHRAGKPLPAHD